MNRIKELRVKAGITRKELADKLSVSQYTVRAYELGTVQVNLDTACEIADFIGCTLAELSGMETRTDRIEYMFLNGLSDGDIAKVEAYADGLRDARS